MLHPLLASKKNVIILVSVVVVAFMITSYYMKQKHLHKQVLLGGQVQLVVQNNALSTGEYNFIKKISSRIAMTRDMRVALPLPNGALDVNVRAVDVDYPLRGSLNIEREKYKVVFSFDNKNKLYGVAVNKPFLQASGMDIGETFTMGPNTYQLRGILKELPDTSGEQLNEMPLLMLREGAMFGSGMFANANKREVRYMILTKKMTALKWVNTFKKRYPKSPATVKRWNA